MEMDTKIQELTDKIYKEGVEKGNEEASRIIAEAVEKQNSILNNAQAEAQQIIAAAEKQASELKKNTEAELKLFAGQYVEALKSEIANLINGKIATSNVAAIVSDKEFMHKIMLEMAKEWVKKEALTMLLDTSKVAWKDNKRCLHYILDDATRAFITLSDEFFYEDMDVFVDDTTKNQQQVEALKQLMQPAMQNGASLLDIAEIITMDNVSMIKQRLEEIEQKRMEQQQQMEQAQAEHEMQMQQMQNEMEEEKLMIEEAKLDTENRKLDLEKYKIDTDANTKIAVAQINAYRGSENMDQDGNGIPDVIEIGKQAIEQQKVNSDAASKRFELNNKKREIEMKRDVENKKIQLEKDKMKQEMELQKQKDKAAMEREKLKAKTAIKNKVTGEK